MADSWLLALAHMATKNWRVASGVWWAIGVMVSPFRGGLVWGGFARLVRADGARPCQQNVGLLQSQRCSWWFAKAVPESLWTDEKKPANPSGLQALARAWGA
jgi:hypothetical protein